MVEMQMTQSSPHIMLGFSGFSIRSRRACVSLSAACAESYKQIFYSLTFTASSLSSPTTPQSSLTPVLQLQSLRRRLRCSRRRRQQWRWRTQSSPHIRLDYSGFSIRRSRACVLLSAACTELYKQIFIALRLPHHHCRLSRHWRQHCSRSCRLKY